MKHCHPAPSQSQWLGEEEMLACGGPACLSSPPHFQLLLIWECKLHWPEMVGACTVDYFFTYTLPLVSSDTSHFLSC